MNTAASKKPTVYMLLPMKVITGPQPIPVFQVSGLTIIPSAQQVRQAMSNLYKTKETVPDQFSYAKFPF